MLKNIPVGYLNCSPENKDVVFWSSFPVCSLGGLEGNLRKFVSIKPGSILIWFDLVWFRLLCQQKGFLGTYFSTALVPLAWTCHVGIEYHIHGHTRVLGLLAVVCRCYWTEHGGDMLTQLTFPAERSLIRWAGAVTRVATVLFHTLATIVAVASIAAAVTWAARPDSRRDLCPLFQVHFLPIQV